MITFVEAFLGSWAIMRTGSFQATDLLSLFLFLGIYFLIYYRKKHITDVMQSKRERLTSQFLGIIYAALYVCGAYERICSGLENRLFQSMILCVTAVGLYFLFYNGVSLLAEACRHVRIRSDQRYSRLFPAAVFGVLFVCWIPCLLKNFPGIMTVDSMNQFAQITGVYSYNNHHPWVHTQIIRLCYEIGSLFTENRSIAISFYTIFQMLFMAACSTYFIMVLARFRVKRWILILTAGFYALIPYQGIYAVTIWKDPMFAGSVLVYVTTLYVLISGMDCNNHTARNCVVLFLSGLGMALLRTNGWYAVLLTAPVIFFYCFRNFRNKKMRVQVITAQILIILAALLIKGPVMESRGVIQPDLVESLSLPAQQIAKVIVNGRELTASQQEFMNRIMDTKKLPALYNPHVSDGFKRLVREGDQEYLKTHLSEFWKIYVQLGMRYPKDYLAAFRDQTIGFWFPAQEGLIAVDEGVIDNELGISNMPLLTGPLVIKFQEILLKLKDILPGYGILWSMGAVFWIILFSAGRLFAKKGVDLLLPYLPVFAILLTLLLASPVAKEFRYFYAGVYSLPLYIMIPFLHQERT